MAFATFSGPVRVGTTPTGTARNTGLVKLIQSSNLITMSGVALTSGAQPQTLFTLPAGSQIVRFIVQKDTALSGNGITECNITIGVPGTVNAFHTTTAMGLSIGLTPRATLDATFQAAAAFDSGLTTDLTIVAVFNAVTGNPTTGSVRITVEYVQRAPNGSANPASV